MGFTRTCGCAPGPVSACLAAAARSEAVLEVIGDGVHLAPATVRMLFDLVGAQGICLITDAMAASGMPDGSYTLGGQDVIVSGRTARLAEGDSIAGGVATMLSGWHRLTSAVCGEYARKLLLVRRFRWSQACSLGTVNPSRKLRRFESFTCHHVLGRASELRKRGSEAHFVYPMGVSKRRRFDGPQSFGS